MATCERYREANRLKDREIERLRRILDVKENKVKWQNQVKMEKNRAESRNSRKSLNRKKSENLTMSKGSGSNFKFIKNVKNKNKKSNYLSLLRVFMVDSQSQGRLDNFSKCNFTH